MPHQPYDPKPVLNGKQRPFANPFDSQDEDDVPDWLEGESWPVTRKTRP